MKTQKSKSRRFTASTETIVDRITEAVLEQRLPPGAKLGEEKLCEIFGVSRPKVRQALNRLAQNKLITLRPRRGAFVTQPSPCEAQQVFDARRVIERELIERFAACATERQLAELDAHLEAERRAIVAGNVALRNRLLGTFHVGIAEFVGNEVLTHVLSDLVSRSSLVTLLFQTSRAASCSSDEHAALIAAIRRHDIDLAIRLMDEHLVHVERDLAIPAEPASKFDLHAALSIARGGTKRRAAA
jgi:DNA-binding GntR family transcriptional regulator